MKADRELAYHLRIYRALLKQDKEAAENMLSRLPSLQNYLRRTQPRGAEPPDHAVELQ